MAFHPLAEPARAEHRMALTAAMRRFQEVKGRADPDAEDFTWRCGETQPGRWFCEAYAWTRERIAVGVVRIEDGEVTQTDVIFGHVCPSDIYLPSAVDPA